MRLVPGSFPAQLPCCYLPSDRNTGALCSCLSYLLATFRARPPLEGKRQILDKYSGITSLSAVYCWNHRCEWVQSTAGTTDVSGCKTKLAWSFSSECLGCAWNEEPHLWFLCGPKLRLAWLYAGQPPSLCRSLPHQPHPAR